MTSAVPDSATPLISTLSLSVSVGSEGGVVGSEAIAG
jgi:hypothetical protein